MIYKNGKPTETLAVPRIDNDVPIPPRAGQLSPVMEAAHAMTIGDSILIPVACSKQMADNLSLATGFKFTQRRQGDNIRIWRIL